MVAEKAPQYATRRDARDMHANICIQQTERNIANTVECVNKVKSAIHKATTDTSQLFTLVRHTDLST